MTEPPIYQGACPYCASAISTVTRDGITYARCSHRGCGARGPQHRTSERAVDIFTRGKWSVRWAPSVQRAPHAAHSDRVLAELRAMTPEQSRKMLVHALERLGWSLLSAEVNVDAQVARIELRRDDLLVTLDARNGAATLTRERVYTTTERTGRRGDVYRSERLHVEFIGRSHYEGVRSAMRSLANYVEDNASTPNALPGAARAAFRAMLGSGS